MTTTYHTPISTGATNAPGTINTPLGALDAAISSVSSAAGLFTAINNGSGETGTVWTVDSTTGFLAGMTVVYALNDGTIKSNTIATVDSSTQITVSTSESGTLADGAIVAAVAPGLAGVAMLGLYNVKAPAYGATGNGSTNDSGAIQAALDAAIAAGGGIVYFPRGTYILSSTITIDNSTNNEPIIFQGQGSEGNNMARGSVIKTTSAGVLFEFVGTAGINRDVSFRDLAFLNTGTVNRTTSSVTAITNDVTLPYSSLSGTFQVGEKVQVGSGNTYATIKSDNGSSSMVITNTTGQCASSVTITGQTSGATATSGAASGNPVARINVINCGFKGLTYGIKLNYGYSDGLEIRNCVFETVFRCIYGQSIEASIIDKCVAEPFTDYFLQVRYPKSLRVSNCLIRGTSQASLRCVPFIFRGQAGTETVYQYGDGVHIDSCHIEDVNAFAYLLDTPRATIRNCWFGLNGVTASDHIFTIAYIGGPQPHNILLENIFFSYVNSGSVDAAKYMIHMPTSGTIDYIESSGTAGATTVNGLRVMGWWPTHPGGGIDYSFHPTNNLWYAYNEGYELFTGRLRMLGGAAPSSGGRSTAIGGGDFVAGDTVYHTSRNGNNVPVGWSCISAGSPGTWVDFGADRVGSTANRPTVGIIGGFQYYDTTLDQMIFRNGGNTGWVDANGATLGEQTYSASNVSTDRTYDADATTLGELADVVGTLIADLRAKNIVA